MLRRQLDALQAVRGARKRPVLDLKVFVRGLHLVTAPLFRCCRDAARLLDRPRPPSRIVDLVRERLVYGTLRRLRASTFQTELSHVAWKKVTEYKVTIILEFIYKLQRHEFLK